MAGLSAVNSDKPAGWLMKKGRRSELPPATLEGITSRLDDRRTSHRNTSTRHAQERWKLERCSLTIAWLRAPFFSIAARLFISTAAPSPLAKSFSRTGGTQIVNLQMLKTESVKSAAEVSYDPITPACICHSVAALST